MAREITPVRSSDAGGSRLNGTQSSSTGVESEEVFRGLQSWLAARGASTSTFSRVMRLQDTYRDLLGLYKVDRLTGLIEALTYGAADERAGKPNVSKVPIEGNLRNGLASLKNAAVLLKIYLNEYYSIPNDTIDHSVAPRARVSPSVRRTRVHYRAAEVLAQATDAMQLNLSELVARCSFWAHQEVVGALFRVDPHATWFPGRRRKKGGERKGQLVGGLLLDDNTYANYAIRLATFGHRDAAGFHACHVWPKTCYDDKYHTSIPNLVLLPAPLAGLSDYDDGVAATLQYRAFELFGWHPLENSPPDRPSSYPIEENWRPTHAPTEEVLRALRDRRPDRPLRAQVSSGMLD